MSEVPIFQVDDMNIHAYSISGGDTYVSIVGVGVQFEFRVTGKLTIQDDRVAAPAPKPHVKSEE